MMMMVKELMVVVMGVVSVFPWRGEVGEEEEGTKYNRSSFSSPHKREQEW